jgi:phytoene dehydrogenase-like protein
MAANYDVVAMGAGHNGLVAAAYLAKAGKKVLVLERKAWPGGGVVTRELNTPGYWHDEHSSVHIMIQGNPMIRQDELGLQSQVRAQVQVRHSVRHDLPGPKHLGRLQGFGQDLRGHRQDIGKGCRDLSPLRESRDGHAAHVRRRHVRAADAHGCLCTP